MIRSCNNIPDDLNNTVCRLYRVADYYKSEEAAQIADEVYDVCAKHGLYGGRFSHGQ